MSDLIEDLKAAVAKVNERPCECVHCDVCHGTGNVRFFFGEYAPNCCDDLCELESCEECQGTGIVEVCDRCREAEELYEQIEEEEERRISHARSR